MIEEYDPVRHHHHLRACVVELQDFERSIEAALPEGQEIALYGKPGFTDYHFQLVKKL